MNGEALTAEQFFAVASDGFDKCEAVEKAATGITEQLVEYGFESDRFRSMTLVFCMNLKAIGLERWF